MRFLTLCIIFLGLLASGLPAVAVDLKDCSSIQEIFQRLACTEVNVAALNAALAGVLKPPPPTTFYKICTGEYERSCQAHDVYLYCGQDPAAWAKDRCASFQVRKLNEYGGNKCGYGLLEIKCIDPK